MPYSGESDLGEASAFSNSFPKAGLSLIRRVAPLPFATQAVCQKLLFYRELWYSITNALGFRIVVPVLSRKTVIGDVSCKRRS